MKALWRVLTGGVVSALEAGCGDDRLPLTVRLALFAGPRRLWQAAQTAFVGFAVFGMGLMWAGIIDSILGLGLMSG
jgi:hypothetical protein